MFLDHLPLEIHRLRGDAFSGKPRFLAAFRTTGCASRAAKTAQIGRRRHYHWLKEDRNYQRAFEQAQEEAFGMLSGSIRRYSDRLLMALLKRMLPEKYG